MHSRAFPLSWSSRGKAAVLGQLAAPGSAGSQRLKQAVRLLLPVAPA